MAPPRKAAAPSAENVTVAAAEAPPPPQRISDGPSRHHVDSSDNEDDPVIAEYDIFITSDISWPEAQPKTVSSDGTKAELFLLHYPTRPRTQPYNGEDTPLSLRMKPKAGFVEVDVPIQQRSNFDARKGQQWGGAVQAVGASHGRGGFGMASGFNSGTMQPVRNVQPQDGDRMDTDQSRLLDRQTLGGMIERPGKGTPRYLLGTFRGSELHLTPITGLAQLRPELYHIDAAAQHNRSATSRGPGGEGMPTRLPPSNAARMLAISHRQTGPGGVSSGDGTGLAHTKELLAQAAEEDWSELQYFDEEATESYEAFQAHAFLPDDDRDELVADWTMDEYLDHIGGASAPAQRAAAVRRTDRRRRQSKAGKRARNASGGKEASTAGAAAAVTVSSGDESSGEDGDEA